MFNMGGSESKWIERLASQCRVKQSLTDVA